MEWDYTQEVARRKLEQELGSREAAEDLSELSEGEKDTTTTKPPAAAAHPSAEEHADDGEHQEPQPRTRLARINSEVRLVSDDEEEQSKKRNLYIVLIRYGDRPTQAETLATANEIFATGRVMFYCGFVRFF